MIKLRYKPLKSGEYSLYLDIYSSDDKGRQKRQYEFLKLYVSKDYNKVNNILAEDRNTVELAENIRKKRELELTSEINGLDVKRKTTHRSLIIYLQDYYDRTGRPQVKTLLYHLNKFSDGTDIPFMDVTTDWLDEFREYLSGEVSQNGVHNYLKDLKARIGEAWRHQVVGHNPFDRFEMPVVTEVERTTLDISEVEKLVATPFPSHPHLRSAFLFACFTGLRMSDTYNLTWDEIRIEQDKDGNKQYAMKIKPIKTQTTTGQYLYAPLTGAAAQILLEIEQDKSLSEKVFHEMPSERNARNLLKLWAAKAGVKKNVHFHAARHTFATLCLTYGMDIYTVSKLLGHCEVRTTEIYGKIVDEKKRAEIQKLPELE